MTTLIRRVSVLAIAFSVFLLTGCAAPPPRTVQEDNGIKSVAVVSLLRENVPINRIGVTVFGNESKSLDQSGELNKISVDVVEHRLHVARPAWNIVKSNADPNVLAEKYEQGGLRGSTIDNVTDDLKKIAQETNADVLFVVMGYKPENALGRGVGVMVHKGFPSRLYASVHAHILLALVDRNGKKMRIGSGGNNVIMPASELGLSDGLAALDDPQVRDRVNAVMRKQLADMLAQAATQMGY